MMTPQAPKSYNFKVKWECIEGTVDSMIQVTDGSVYPPQQMQMQIPGVQAIPLPIVNFKFGTWVRSNQLGGIDFE